MILILEAGGVVFERLAAEPSEGLLAAVVETRNADIQLRISFRNIAAHSSRASRMQMVGLPNTLHILKCLLLKECDTIQSLVTTGRNRFSSASENLHIMLRWSPSSAITTSSATPRTVESRSTIYQVTYQILG